jgi:hypothetical protein
LRQNERDMKNPKGDRERLQRDTVGAQRPAPGALDEFVRLSSHEPIDRVRYHSTSRPTAIVINVSGAPTLK